MYLPNLATFTFAIAYLVYGSTIPELVIPLVILLIGITFGYLAAKKKEAEDITEHILFVIWIILVVVALLLKNREPDLGAYLLLSLGSIWTGMIVAQKRFAVFMDVFWPVFGVSIFLLFRLWNEVNELGFMILLIMLAPVSIIVLISTGLRLPGSVIGGILWIVVFTVFAILSNVPGIAAMAFLGTIGMIVLRVIDAQEHELRMSP